MTYPSTISTVTFNNSPALELRSGESRAIVLLHGAQVVSWTVEGREQLYVSPTATFRDGEAIRGGIPICFPQFNEMGPLPKHGFARTATWAPASPAREDAASLTLVLADTSATRAIWPHAFHASLTVRLGAGELDVGLEVANDGSSALAFTGALHTYFRLDDTESARVQGLDGIEYLDHLTGQAGCDDAASLAIDAIGRTYRDPRRRLELHDGGRRVAIEQRGFENVVVWNPGAEIAFPDLPSEGWRRFVCVEAAQVSRPVTIAAGERWSGGQRLQLTGQGADRN